MDRIKRLKVGRDQAGFTLIELLVVITILGILAAIVVFSVGGINDKGQLSACKTDTTTLQTAEEANFARAGASNGVAGGRYVSEPDLVAAGLLNSESNLHNIVLVAATPTALATFNVPAQTDATTPANPDNPCTGTNAG